MASRPIGGKILVLCHIIACLWYAIGNMNKYGDQTWLEFYSIKSRSFGYRYSTALYWTLAQLGVGVTSIEPQNEVERFFAIFVLFSALIIFSALVSTITNSMQQIQSMCASETRQLWLVRRFLQDNLTSQDLTVRVRKYLLHAIQKKKVRIGPDDIPIFKLLSEPLFAELQYQRYELAIQEQPFFAKVMHVAQNHMTVLHKICVKAITVCWTATGDVLFSAGHVATSCYYLNLGHLVYKQVDCNQAIDVGVWISEAVLWTDWSHVGELLTQEEGQLFALEAAGFSMMVSSHSKYFEIARHYARNFVTELNKAVTNLSDIPKQQPRTPWIDSTFSSQASSSEACCACLGWRKAR